MSPDEPGQSSKRDRSDRPDQSEKPVQSPQHEEAVEQPAVDQSPENVPAQAGELRTVGERRGMFGVTGSGDTSGYGRLVREVALPGSSPRPYGGYFDEVVDALISLGVVKMFVPASLGGLEASVAQGCAAIEEL